AAAVSAASDARASKAAASRTPVVRAHVSAAAVKPMLGDTAPRAGIAAETLPQGFTDRAALSGLTFPTNFRFAADGRIFVAEKSGLVKVFSSLSDTTPTVVADLRSEVDDYWDRGLLGLALDPNF